jgi:hypothetical protein
MEEDAPSTTGLQITRKWPQERSYSWLENIAAVLAVCFKLLET